MRLKLHPVSAIIITLLCSLPVHAQSEKTLDLAFTEIMDGAESYQDYKVIRTSRLTEFKLALFDSLNSYRSTISTLQSDFISVKKEMKDLRKQFNQVQASLEKAEASSDLINFLWFDMKKFTYSLFVWSVVALLILCLVIMYGRIKHVCAVVKRVKTAYSKIVDDYRNQRFQATEKQIKLKRELQTALNKLETVQGLER